MDPALTAVLVVLAVLLIAGLLGGRGSHGLTGDPDVPDPPRGEDRVMRTAGGFKPIDEAAKRPATAPPKPSDYGGEAQASDPLIEALRDAADPILSDLGVSAGREDWERFEEALKDLGAHPYVCPDCGSEAPGHRGDVQIKHPDPQKLYGMTVCTNTFHDLPTNEEDK